ncbi:MAG: sucrase ferredoxin [Caldilineaceae bacterium]
MIPRAVQDISTTPSSSRRRCRGTRSLREGGSALPQEMVDLLALWLQRYRAGAPYNHRPLLIGPDDEYSQPGHRRVIFFRKPTGAFANFERTEYLVPGAETGPLLWAIYEAQDDLPRFDAYRVDTVADVRDLLVCTHGSIDVACAKFGYPLYDRLRKHYAGDGVRVWRVSHFGGHVYAPTMMEMPSGHYWAYVDADQADQIALRRGDVTCLRGHYRGWAGASHGFAQAAERELFLRFGWDWMDQARTCTVVDSDDAPEPQWQDVRIETVPGVTSPDGVRDSFMLRVEIERSVETVHATDNARVIAYPQYRAAESLSLCGYPQRDQHR